MTTYRKFEHVLTDSLDDPQVRAEWEQLDHETGNAVADEVSIERLAEGLGVEVELIRAAVWSGYDPRKRAGLRLAGSFMLTRPAIAAVHAWLREVTAITDWYRWASDDYAYPSRPTTFHAVQWMPDLRDDWRATNGSSTRDKLLVTLCGLRHMPKREKGEVVFSPWHARNLGHAIELLRLAQHGYEQPILLWNRCIACEAVAVAGNIAVEW